MKTKIAAVLIILGFLVSGAWAVVPVGYDNIDSRNGLNTYMKSNGNIAVIVADTKKSKITFGVGDEGAAYTNKGKTHRTFKRISIKDHYDNNDAGKLYMALNGQFFSWMDFSPLSFNVKMNNDILQAHILEGEKGKRLFAIMSNGLPFMYKGKNSDNEGAIQYQIVNMLKRKLNGNDVITDAITGLNPFDREVQNKIGASNSKGRNMIGCIPYSNYDKGIYGICKKVLFFIAKSSSQNTLISEMKKWGIKNDYMITLDGSGSAQAFSRDFKYNNRDFIMKGDRRPIPNSILIYSN